MRVEHPDQYAETLFSITQPEEGYTAQHIRSLYGRGERNINLKTPIPVYLTYQTTFVDDSGHLQTRSDIYGLDKAIVDLLRRYFQVLMSRLPEIMEATVSRLGAGRRLGTS